VIGGDFSGASGTSAPNLVSWNGSSWRALGAGFSDGSVRALASYRVGGTETLVAAGSFLSTGAQAARGVASWNGTSWSALGGGINGGSSAACNALATFDAGMGRELYVGGQFESIGTAQASRIARWDGTAWRIVHESNGLDGGVGSLVCHDDGHGPSLFVSGAFTHGGDVPVSGIARFDGIRWYPVGDSATVSSSGITRLLCSYAGGLYALGRSTPTSSWPDRLMRWDGNTWSIVGEADGLISAAGLHDDGNGLALYMAGYFTKVSGIAANCLARWNGSNWSAVSTTAPDRVYALASYDDGTGRALYVAGQFSSVGGVQAKNIAKWDGVAWSAVGAGITGQYYPEVRALCVYDDATGPALYATGTFEWAGYVHVHGGIARWNGTAWAGLDTASPAPNWSGTSLAVHDDGSGSALYVIGEFNTVDWIPALGIARWNGIAWSALGGGAFSPLAVASFDTGSGAKLAVGGWSLHPGAATPTCIAVWESCDQGSPTTCAGDGSAVPCPCGNNSVLGAGEGCLSSFDRGGRLRGLGRRSVSNDQFVLQADQIANGPALFFQGTETIAPFVFGDGLRCVGGIKRRLGVQQAVNGVASFPSAGTPSVSQAGAMTPSGGVRSYQVWYRNTATFCAPSGFNITNGISVTWTP
jgi:hypothetical protein